jgi:hypothetical protein
MKSLKCKDPRGSLLELPHIRIQLDNTEGNKGIIRRGKKCYISINVEQYQLKK